MKTIAKLATGAILACGLAAAATAPAIAAVHFNVGIGAPVVTPPAAYACYNAYGNYVYSYPYCTAYPAPYVASQVNLTFGDRDRGAFRDQDRDHGRQVGRGDDHGDRGGRGRDRG
jgi:hypothetical protein